MSMFRSSDVGMNRQEMIEALQQLADYGYYSYPRHIDELVQIGLVERTNEHFPMYGKLTELGEAMVTCLGIEEAE
jgi:hypothetical protein